MVTIAESGPGSTIDTELSQGTVNEIIFVVTAPPVAVTVYEAVKVPNEVVGIVTVRQAALVLGDPHPVCVIPAPVARYDMTGQAEFELVVKAGKM